MKLKTVYICSSCGHDSPKWQGQCPQCGQWNTMIEEVVQKKEAKALRSRSSDPQWVPLSEVDTISFDRLDTQDRELNRILGGGVVPGSVILIAGEPGIGKSTLSIQLANIQGLSVLYVTGEESRQQVKMRADRLGVHNPQCFVSDKTEISTLLAQASQLKPDLLIVDSIQTMNYAALESATGTVSQIRECTALLQRFAKENNTAVLIIGHITKEGSIAGPKLLEHIVDVVLHFEGLKHNNYRMLRGIKNRFGSAFEIGVYEMKENGMHPVDNPSALLIDPENSGLSGNAIGILTEGQRPMMIECQALVTQAVYGTPQRSSTGYDAKRLNMLLAVLEKRCGLPLGACDVFLNIVGGLKVQDPALDLPVLAAIISSLQDIAIPKNICLFGEIGLSGEVRPVQKADARLGEAARMNFAGVLLPSKNQSTVHDDSAGIRVLPLQTVENLIEKLFT